ncbi:MAG: TIGR01459 family HAD-type hydrolase [Alphaproteobacteria bacterium]|nr:TIGR01459 family HAD-type hydrolase [Alphaproteobacteria bacterium]
MPKSIPVIRSISPLAAGSVAWLVDIWGVMHNGVRPFVEAGDACARFREDGGTVLLLSNSPRPGAGVKAQLDAIGVREDSYDGILSSGDATRELIADYAGRSVYHLGPERDLPLFDGIDVKRVGPDESEGAEVIVCTGLFDDTIETPADYATRLQGFKARGLPMICANPDIKVERGGQVIYCGGAIAEAYAALGAEVSLAGKPHAPIYDMAFEWLAEQRGREVSKSKAMAIGDGVKTDIAGGILAGIRAVYIASRVHMGDDEALEPGVLDTLFPDPNARPVAAMASLVW